VTIEGARLRGLLIHTHSTKVVNAGMVINLLSTAVILLVGVQSRLDGFLTAAIALNGATLVELVI